MGFWAFRTPSFWNFFYHYLVYLTELLYQVIFQLVVIWRKACLLLHSKVPEPMFYMLPTHLYNFFVCNGYAWNWLYNRFLLLSLLNCHWHWNDSMSFMIFCSIKISELRLNNIVPIICRWCNWEEEEGDTILIKICHACSINFVFRPIVPMM